MNPLLVLLKGTQTRIHHLQFSLIRSLRSPIVDSQASCDSVMYELFFGGLIEILLKKKLLKIVEKLTN